MTIAIPIIIESTTVLSDYFLKMKNLDTITIVHSFFIVFFVSNYVLINIVVLFVKYCITFLLLIIIINNNNIVHFFAVFCLFFYAQTSIIIIYLLCNFVIYIINFEL